MTTPKSDGSGYGSGSGYGDGDGDGSGYGKNQKSYLQAILDAAGGESASQLRGAGATLAFWRSDADGKPANGGSSEPAKVGLVQEIQGPLALCTRNALHATLDPWKWKGERWWVVALHGKVETDEHKLGALKREIVADLGRCPF